MVSRFFAPAGFAAVVALALAAACPAQATPVTQSTAPAGSDSSNSWNWQQLGSVALASGTNTILGLTSVATLVDQGWGGQDPGDNQVLVSLFDNGQDMWNQHVAGAYHYSTTQAFDISTDDNAASLLSLNTVLGGIDWSTDPTVLLEMNAVPLGYGGWELHVQNASFNVTSDTVPVPEPASIALVGMALATVTFMSRRRSIG